MLDAIHTALDETLAAIRVAAHALAPGRGDDGRSPPEFACAEPAQLWLATGWRLEATTTFEISSPLRSEEIIFVSGTAISAVAAGFQQLQLDAEVDPASPMRIRLGFGQGPEAFLCVRQIDRGDAPLVCSGPFTRDPLHERCDEGVDSTTATFGDLTCDGDVDGFDLARLLDRWNDVGPLGDLDGSGSVDGPDLALLLGAWSPPIGGSERLDDGERGICPAPAELWLSTGAWFTNGGEGEVTFVVSTSTCGQMLTFASGTSQADILNAMNSLTCLGIGAEQDPTNPARVRLGTIGSGLQQFVCVQQLDGEDPGFLFTSAHDGDGDTALCDVGEGGFLGDLDCDLDVGPSDLAILLGAWGASHHVADLDGDGVVTVEDLAILLGVWGE